MLTQAGGILRTSNVLKWVAPIKSAMRSSIIGIRCFSLLIALFASRMSTQILTSPDFLGAATIGLIQGVGPSTVSMMSNFSSLLSSFSTSLTWKGIRQWGCCWSVMSGSICNFTSLFGTFPMPPNKDLNSSFRNSGLFVSLSVIVAVLTDTVIRPGFCAVW